MKQTSEQPSDSWREDKVLVDRMLRGDRTAFDAFCDAYFDRLYRYALKRLDHNEDLTTDITQSAITKAIDKLDSYRGEAPLVTWLYAICRYEITAYFRTKKRRPPQVELAEDSPEVYAVLDSMTGKENPETILGRKEVVQVVHTALDRLPVHYGDALEWRYLEGASVREVAERLEIGPKAAESLLTRARQAFRQAFSALGRNPKDQLLGAGRLLRGTRP